MRRSKGGRPTSGRMPPHRVGRESHLTLSARPLQSDRCDGPHNFTTDTYRVDRTGRRMTEKHHHIPDARCTWNDVRTCCIDPNTKLEPDKHTYASLLVLVCPYLSLSSQDSLGGVVAEQSPRDGHHGGGAPSHNRAPKLQRLVVPKGTPLDGNLRAPQIKAIPGAVDLKD